MTSQRRCPSREGRCERPVVVPVSVLSVSLSGRRWAELVVDTSVGLCNAACSEHSFRLRVWIDGAAIYRNAVQRGAVIELVRRKPWLPCAPTTPLGALFTSRVCSPGDAEEDEPSGSESDHLPDELCSSGQCFLGSQEYPAIKPPIRVMITRACSVHDDNNGLRAPLADCECLKDFQVLSGTDTAQAKEGERVQFTRPALPRLPSSLALLTICSQPSHAYAARRQDRQPATESRQPAHRPWSSLLSFSSSTSTSSSPT